MRPIAILLLLCSTASAQVCVNGVCSFPRLTRLSSYRIIEYSPVTTGEVIEAPVEVVGGEIIIPTMPAAPTVLPVRVCRSASLVPLAGYTVREIRTTRVTPFAQRAAYRLGVRRRPIAGVLSRIRTRWAARAWCR